MAPPVNSAALLRRRRELLDNLRAVTGSQLAAIWNSLDGYSDDRQWRARAVPVLTAGQSRAISLQIASLEAILAAPLVFDRHAVLERAAIDINQPFIALATALQDGQPFVDAVEAGAARAEGVGESGITFASRAANSAADDHVTGWERVPSAGACSWCALVAEQTYKTADSASFGHLRCSCDVIPAS